MEFYVEEIPAEEIDAKFLLQSYSSSEGPVGRGGCSVSLIGSSKLYLIGGADREAKHFNDVNIFDIETSKWKEVHPKGSTFDPRSGHSSTAVGDLIYVFGGCNSQCGKIYDTLYVLDTEQNRWSEPKTTGFRPPGLNSHTATLIQSENTIRIVIFGGSTSTGPTNDVFELDITDPTNLVWQKKNCSGSESPAPRELHAATMIESNRIIVTGGRHVNGVYQDGFELCLDSWRWSKVENLPFPVCAHTIFRFEDGSLAYFGGWDGKESVLNDLWYKGIGKDAKWERQAVSGPDVHVRFGHCGCLVGKEYFLFGGINLAFDISDMQMISECPFQN